MRLPSDFDGWSLLSAAFPPCEKKSFSCQTRLLHKGEHVWSGFQDIETPHKQLLHRELWAAHGSFAVGLGRSSWEIDKGCFPEQILIWAGVPSLSRKYFARKKLPASFFIEFVGVPYVLSTLTLYVLLSQLVKKKRHFHAK